MALLRLKLRSTVATGITALKLSHTSHLSGGEDIKVIGFPDSTAFWTVSNGSVARIEGRNLVFSGAIRGGNSGGPVIFNRLVIGMVTDVSQAAAYAVRGEIIETYANGIVANLISVATPISTRPANNSESNDELCGILNSLLDASKGGFYSIVGDPSNSENTFKSRIVMPDAIDGYVRPPKVAHYRFLIEKDKGKVESLFYTYVTRIRGCFPKWEEKEDSDSTYHYNKFRKNKGGVVVEMYYNPVAQREYYYLLLDVTVPDSNRSEW